jgi:GTP-binding protein
VREVETGALVADLAHDGARVVVARGGAGGRGNKRYATPTRQAPRTAQVGLDGEERTLELRLKLLSDAAMLGFPNAGKSSLLDRISNARPKVADYPFTTIEPQLGTVESDDGSQLTVADVPGLLEGASEGIGLGHEFLAHLERARALLHIVPVEPGEDLLADCRARYCTIHNELVQHGEGLAALPQIVVINKLDLLPPETGDALVAAFKQAIVDENDLADQQVLRDDEGVPRVYGISCATRQGIDTLRSALFAALVPIEAPAPDPVGEPELADFLVYRPHAGARAWRLLRDDGILRVAGREIEQAVSRHDVETAEGAVALAAEIDRLGLSSALRRAGARSGDEIAVGDHRFTYIPPRAVEPADEGPDADAEW